LADTGIWGFDGNTIFELSGDIKNLFDPLDSEYIGSDFSSFSSFYDSYNFEYHLLAGSDEWVFDIHKKAWYRVDRGISKDLTCGFKVVDSNGKGSLYGGSSDGYLERLEYGTTFDGNALDYTFRNGDIPLSKSLVYETNLRHIKLTAIGKNTDTTDITVTHYGDTSTSGTTLSSSTGVPQTTTAKRLYQHNISCGNINAVLHSLKFNIATTLENVGFEPLMISYQFKVTRQDEVARR
jgi:hypothetical protein